MLSHWLQCMITTWLCLRKRENKRKRNNPDPLFRFPGGSLDQYIGNDEPFTEEESFFIFYQLASGLQVIKHVLLFWMATKDAGLPVVSS